MKVLKVLLKLARKAGPIAFAAAVRYGPQLRKLVAENPQVVEKITNRFKKADDARENGTLDQRVQVLREQVTYLYASANTSEAARQAAQWRAELEAYQQAILILQAMSRRQKFVEQRRITHKLDHLSSQILAASLIDSVEDAEIVGDAPEPGKAEAEHPGTTSEERKTSEEGKVGEEGKASEEERPG